MKHFRQFPESNFYLFLRGALDGCRHEVQPGRNEVTLLLSLPGSNGTDADFDFEAKDEEVPGRYVYHRIEQFDRHGNVEAAVYATGFVCRADVWQHLYDAQRNPSAQVVGFDDENGYDWKPADEAVETKIDARHSDPARN